MCWMIGWLGQLGKSTSWWDSVDLPKTITTTDHYLWTRSSPFQGNWLDQKTINKGPHGSMMCMNWCVCNDYWNIYHAMWCFYRKTLCLSVEMMSLDTTNLLGVLFPFYISTNYVLFFSGLPKNPTFPYCQINNMKTKGTIENYQNL